VFEEAGRELLRFEDGEQRPTSLNVLGEDGPVRAAVAAIARTGATPVSEGSLEYVLHELLIGMRSTGAGGMLILSPTEPTDAMLEQVKYRPEDPMLLNRAMGADRKAMFARFLHSPVEDAIEVDDTEATAKVVYERARQHLIEAIGDLSALSAIDGALLTGPGARRQLLAPIDDNYTSPSVDLISFTSS
jgi:hypothetical protein